MKDVVNKDKSDLCWGMYQEHTIQGRHHEAQRTSANTILAAVAGGVVTLIGNGGITVEKWPLAAFLIALGLFGVIFTLKQTERGKFHTEIAGKYREELKDIVDLTSIREEVKKNPSYTLSSLSGLGLWVVWMSLDIFIAVLGALLLCLSLLSHQPGSQP